MRSIGFKPMDMRERKAKPFLLFSGNRPKKAFLYPYLLKFFFRNDLILLPFRPFPTL